MPPQIPKGLVEPILKFYGPPVDGSVPHYIVEPQAGEPQRNYRQLDRTVTIQDIRGNESAFSLDYNGFVALSIDSASKAICFDNDEQIRNDYYPEVEQLLSSLPGVNQVFVFDHTVRRSDPDAPSGPVYHVHVDQTPASAKDRVRLHLPDAAERLLNGRVRIINVWRPLNGPVYGNPLALADSSTVADGDLIVIRHIYPTREGQTYAVNYNENQKWYYWSGIHDNERILLECFDSEKGGRVPHSAFVDPRTPEGAPGRESIEVRALVFG